MAVRGGWARGVLGLGAAAAVLCGCSATPQPQSPVDSQPPLAVNAVEHRAPAPAAPVAGGTDTLTVAGGCFWGVQGLYQHVNGVASAESGYIGGTAETANYPMVETGQTAHTEAVQIRFDPAVVSSDELLAVFFDVVEKPVELTNRGTDVHATQYQSAIYVRDDGQRDAAQAAIGRTSATLGAPVVTAVLPATTFFAAEPYHQDFMFRNPTEPYIASSEMPKLADLQREFPQQFRAQPVLMYPGAPV